MGYTITYHNECGGLLLALKSTYNSRSKKNHNECKTATPTNSEALQYGKINQHYK